MDTAFWHERWQTGQIAFHEGAPNELLVAHFAALGLAPDARVFVPLCGKTRDIAWLLGQGYSVVGAELSEIAIRELFADLGAEPVVTSEGALKRFHADGLDIFVGDVFALTAGMLGTVDAVFDRAALVALPEEMRVQYAAHIPEITANAAQLLITFEYDQSVMPGPPFAVPAPAVHGFFDGRFAVTELARRDVKGGLKGKAKADEIIWHLVART